ncbi:aldo-keto reductase family 1 member B1-like [Mercenaria mercenaria]|uniref:aldo-keto reductase family 1 member B1-like n=1 Tax=Mercenaria mercenaria TaxID=6596 RepID=UPI00234E5032|nr:aldo-keto reductase family 1 member B1-like [Mercenaria mercenaria]
MIQHTSLLRPILLNNGAKMPRIGVGTYLLQGELCREIVERALQLGYRHVDTAHSYENEKDIGVAIHAIERRGNISRKQLFVTTKVNRIYQHPVDVKLSLEESLEDLKSKYVDLLLIHSPWGLKNRGDGDTKPMREDGTFDCYPYDLKATWRAMEDAVHAGKVKSIGLSNFTEKLTKMILANARIRPQNLQFECHAYYQQNQLKSFCDENQISCTAYAPLGAPGKPMWHASEEDSKCKLLEDKTVLDIADKYERTPAQILLRFLLERNIAVIPKTSSVQRLEENETVFDFDLEGGDVQKLKSLDRGIRFFLFKQYSHHSYFPQKNEPF